ncbi:hypothetical protein JTB14_027911 [Gonioctena quinquepunctata]|nr:hypothetical protein JTB14_027911 [Gonioctena quinquepunctata]
MTQREDPRDQLGTVATWFRSHNRESPRRGEVLTIGGAGLQVARRNKKAGGWGINESVSASTEGANKSGEKLTTGQPEIPPADEPTSSGHPREATATTKSPEDFEGPITRTQETTGTPMTATTGAWAVARMEGTTLPNLERTTNLGANRPGLQIARGGTHGATVHFRSTHGYGRAEPRTGGVLVLSCSIV